MLSSQKCCIKVQVHLICPGQLLLLSESGEDLATNMIESASSINQISSNIQSVKNQTLTQAALVIEVMKAKINESMKGIAAAASQVMSSFESISSGVETVSKQETEIRHSMEEQNEGGRQILCSIISLNTLVGEVGKFRV